VQIGQIVDPTQHTALVMGTIPNPAGELRAGQFIKATVLLPPAGDAVSIPIGALVEDGKESIVFVQPDPKENRFVMRHVSVTRRGLDEAEVRAGVLREGERVVRSGSLELKAALEDLQAAAKEKK
jgi:cobalt-zinc-cadmium efflux system membrane fusion protein